MPRKAKTEPETLFDYDDWLMRQQAAGVPLILTDTPRIENKDISALRKALARWDAIDEPTLVVLPIEPWWLRDGLPGLIERSGRPGGRWRSSCCTGTTASTSRERSRAS
jgi:hypothetical protein